jgi:threonylcarbamoyladenosine tRNA methylthiotransferase MtaB
VRFRITTLGCKVNQYESAALAEAFVRAGLTPACRPDDPVELVVVHTCCVTAAAMAKSRRAVARQVRRSSGAAVLVTGCYADYDARRLGRLLAQQGVPPQRAVFAGHHDNLSARIARALALAAAGADRASVRLHRQEQQTSLSEGGACIPPPAASCLPASTPSSIQSRRQAAVKQKLPPATAHLPGLKSFPHRHRAMVKIQDGCDAFCSYCIVPYLRCWMWSRPAEAVESECRDLVAAGHREIVLCGVFLGAYGRDTAVAGRGEGRTSQLPNLIRRIGRIEGLWRLRLSSLECGDVTEEFLATCRRTPNLAPHFHLPLQSGSNRILRRMNRRYTVEQYLQTLARLREAMDRPAITTDILVGFPGEDEADFAATLAAARQAGFSKIHAFPFSPIEGTAAWAFRHEAPPPPVVKARMAELMATEKELAAAYHRTFFNEQVQALVERSLSDGRSIARTDRYFTIELTAPGVQPGQVVLATIEGQDGIRLSAKLDRILWENPNPEAQNPKQTTIQQVRSPQA